MRVCDFIIVGKIGLEHVNEAHVGTEHRVKGGDPGETGLPQSSKQMAQLSITSRNDVLSLADKDRPGKLLHFLLLPPPLGITNIYWNLLMANVNQAVGSHV